MSAKDLVGRMLIPLREVSAPRGPRETFIAAGCRLEGRVTFSGPGAFAGEVEGAILSEDLLVIEPEALVNGDVSGRRVVVKGRVRGQIYASESATVTQTANVEGDVTAPAVTVEAGARFNGRINMPANDMGEAEPTHVRRAAEPLWAAAE